MEVIDEANVKLGQAFDTISKIRELFVQGVNGTNSKDEIDMIQTEINEHLRFLDTLSPGESLSEIDQDDPTGGLYREDFQVGADDSAVKNLDFFLNPASEDDVSINLYTTTVNWNFGGTPSYTGYVGLNKNGNNPRDSIGNIMLPGTTLDAYEGGAPSNSVGTLTKIDQNLDALREMQSVITGKQEYFKAKYNELESTEIAFSELKSNYMDLDIAKESSKFVNNQLKTQRPILID